VEAPLPLSRAPFLEPTLALFLTSILMTSQLNVVSSWPVWLGDGILVLCAALCGRFPLTTFAIMLPTLVGLAFVAPQDIGAGALGGFIVIFSWGARNRRGQAWVTLSLMVGIYLGLGVGVEGFPPSAFTHVFLVITLVVTIGAAQGWRWLGRFYAAQRAQAAQQVRDLQVGLARDLHDTVAQTLSHAAMRAWMAADDEVSPQTRRSLVQIAEECSAAAGDLRQLLSTLRETQPGGDPQFGPLADADSLAEEVHAQARRLTEAGFAVRARVEVRQVSAARAQTLTQVSREAVTNMVKYAPVGSEVTVSLIEQGGIVYATFQNPDPGGRVDRRGWGLIGMEERLALLKGTLSLDRSGGLWTVRAALPTGAPSAPDAAGEPPAGP
jgi:signal transduction histidine kinase